MDGYKEKRVLCTEELPLQKCFTKGTVYDARLYDDGLWKVKGDNGNIINFRNGSAVYLEFDNYFRDITGKENEIVCQKEDDLDR